MSDWRAIIPASDREIYEAAGYGRRTTPGYAPALLVIDVTYGFVGRERLPILESIRKYSTSCGEFGWRAVEPIRALIGRCRAGEWPIYYTAGVTDSVVEHAGRWRDKHPRTLDAPDDSQTIVEEIAPQAGDVVIRKAKPSAFFGTPLVSSLIDCGVDTLIVTGCTTSGCVRATVIDAFSYGFRTLVPEDATFDRGQMSHAVNLFEMDQKYADVMPSADVLAYLDSLAVNGTARRSA
ncbi:MAG TPA: isochorismatase family protein [Solirubrobacter sp.]|nr:isochorismatase family protein [Solirubrobacter sp.]